MIGIWIEKKRNKKNCNGYWNDFIKIDDVMSNGTLQQ